MFLVSTEIKCVDCSKYMTEDELKSHKALSLELQRVNGKRVAICPACLEERETEGEDPEDMIAEFCG